ncbi:hypothetical protein C3747_31g147 [Trypanosoma cruzi]|uniref:Uncharacterized protein n=2 Tax=Trypanosoma cruzi TaxID=5693 RepID=Q4DDN9_TRYCC|nr:hypothetical protein, conserved [Trypanosoma cruzi]EAN90637.1 hypothetical protein, conserved [Trypanosoma cruzi]PWV15193.1 hypothetical protein C3747_31g147 [Trypanosoma cruzi]|eukprot:XP_812488.1 hypothetical protein [Trypanosoma cruzi strain CL Brener]
MGSYENVGWKFVEEAVIRDKGYDEEIVLASILQSYFIRQGFVESLTALNEELRELQTMTRTGTTPMAETSATTETKEVTGRRVRRNGKGICVNQEELRNDVVSHDDGRKNSNGSGKNSGTIHVSNDNKNNNNNSVGCKGVETVLESMKKRKRLQLLCLNEQYEDAAASLPQGSVFIVKLLAMEAMKRAKGDQSAALLFLCEKVSPLIADMSDAAMAHQIYVETLATITGTDATECSEASPCRIAREVNESLLDDHEPSALHVLLSWSEWQAMAKAKEGREADGRQFPFLVGMERP